MDSRRGLRGAQSERAAINGSQFLFQSGKGIAVTESGGSLERRGSAVDLKMLREQAQNATAAPLRVFRIADIDAEGALQQALQAGPDEVWVVRPDAHIAAVCASGDGQLVRDALQRVMGRRADASV